MFLFLSELNFRRTFLRDFQNRGFTLISSEILLCIITIWVWVKIRYPNNWMVNTKLD